MVDRVKGEKVAEVQSVVPEGSVIDAYYDRSVLIEKTVADRRPERRGVLVRSSFSLALLGNLRAGLIVALAIPLSMLFAGNLMPRSAWRGA